MKVLLTGAAGFIGSELAHRLLSEGHDVCGVDCFTPYYDVQLKHDRVARLTPFPSFEMHPIRVEDDDAMKKVFHDFMPDIVVHLAAQAGVRYSLDHPREYIDANVVGSFNVASELIAHSHSHLYGTPTTMLRFFSVYGPWGRPDMAFFLFTDKIFKGIPIDVFNHGDLLRDFTYVEDLVEAIRRLMDTPPEMGAPVSQNDSLSPVAPYRLVNIGNETPVRLMDYIEAIEDAIGRKAVKNMIGMQPGDVKQTYADASLLKALTGYVPTTDVRTGVTAFVKWYREYYKPE